MRFASLFCFLCFVLLILPACNHVHPAMVTINDTDDTLAEETRQAILENDMPISEDSDRPSGWEEITHGKSGELNYDVVFPQDYVNRIDFIIDPADWQVMLDDMTSLYGEFGSQREQGPGGRQLPGERPPQPEGQLPENTGRDSPPFEDAPPNMELTPPQGRDRQPFAGKDIGIMESDTNPIYVPVTVIFENEVWTNVGLRFKGNSSLRSTWGSGSLKLPFRLDFDQFEDKYPEINDQRFYGFKQLAFSSNWSDASYLREKVTADIFRDAGVPASQTAFYEVFIDYGEGSIYLGLYTLTEIVDDTIIKTQFEDDDGNVYKPSGNAATFAKGSFSEKAFDKQTNEDEGWSDILALFAALHAESRISEPDKWRENLEAVFDVDGFLNWLATNTVVQNWDTYGAMSHNYYLYHDPVSDKLVWIPWDNNMALSSELGMRTTLSLGMEEVNERWPLIRYMLDDEIYYKKYIQFVEAVITGAFAPEEIEETYRAYTNLIEVSVLQEIASGQLGTNPNRFYTSVDELVQHAYERRTAVTDFLAQQ